MHTEGIFDAPKSNSWPVSNVNVPRFLPAALIVPNMHSGSCWLVSDWKVTVGRAISLKCLSNNSGLHKPIDWSSESQGKNVILGREEFDFSGVNVNTVSFSIDGSGDKQ